MKKIMILISVIFLMCTGIWFRFHTKECRVVSDLAYDKNKKGDHLVYIREGHELVPFLVLRDTTVEERSTENEYADKFL